MLVLERLYYAQELRHIVIVQREPEAEAFGGRRCHGYHVDVDACLGNCGQGVLHNGLVERYVVESYR